MAHFDDSATNARLEELRHGEEERLVASLAAKFGYPYINLNDFPIDIEALGLFTEEESKKGDLVAFAKTGNSVSVAIRDSKNEAVVPLLQKLVDQNLSPLVHLTSSDSLHHAQERYKDLEHTTAQVKGVLAVDADMITHFMTELHSHLDVSAEITKLEKAEGTMHTSKIIEVIFGGALALKASDIHIEPEQVTTRVRYRLDGVLFDICTVEKDVSAHIISRLKLLSGLKLNMRKESQDGRFTFNVGTRDVEVRSSVIPGAYGESVVMRLLDPSISTFRIENLGLNARLFEIMEHELKRPNGTIITTGPTGSGKTTALYSFLLAVHTPELKIITLEDPVEYKLPGIVQTQVSETYSFAEGLRTILRQDPDVILIGEIRDREVAETTIHAALTGHLVFSTLHTNSAAAAFARLIDLGIDPRMIGSACNVILGQRLVRVLCKKCQVEREITTEEQKMVARILGEPTTITTVHDTKGCDECNMSGYKGRIGVYEAILIDEAVENAVLDDTRESVILEAAKKQNIPSMQQDGIYKVLAGITTFDELSRVLGLYHD